MKHTSLKIICLIAGTLPLAAQEFAAQECAVQEYESCEPTSYVYTEEVVYQTDDFDADAFDNIWIRRPGDLTEIIATSNTAAEIIEKVGKEMLKENLFHYGFVQGYTEEEQRALTHEEVANSEYGKISQAGIRRMAYFLDQIPPRIRSVAECLFFQPVAQRSSHARSLSLGEAFDLGCQCAMELHEVTTGLLPGTSAQKSAALWGLYVPSIVIARWVTDDISEEQVREIVELQKHVLQRFVIAALPHLCEMWIRFAPFLPQIREALQEPVNHLMLDLQHVTNELVQEYTPDEVDAKEIFDTCECSYKLDESNCAIIEEQTAGASTEDVIQK